MCRTREKDNKERKHVTNPALYTPEFDVGGSIHSWVGLDDVRVIL